MEIRTQSKSGPPVHSMADRTSAPNCMRHAVDRLLVEHRTLAAELIASKVDRGKQPRSNGPPGFAARGGPLADAQERGRPLMSRVDVIVPCYKYAHFLRECVESILSQSLTDVRVLIIDDASPDHTPEVAAELAARDKRVEYRRHSVNHGHIATYNEGLEWATADYVLLLSADDLLTPGALHRATRFLDAHPEVGLAYGRHIDFQTGQMLKPVPDSAECDGWVLSYEEFLEASCKLGHTPIQSPAAIVRNQVHREVGGYRPELPHSGDTELWLRLAARAPVGVLDAEQAYRRWHIANMTFRYTPVATCVSSGLPSRSTSAIMAIA